MKSPQSGTAFSFLGLIGLLIFTAAMLQFPLDSALTGIKDLVSGHALAIEMRAPATSHMAVAIWAGFTSFLACLTLIFSKIITSTFGNSSTYDKEGLALTINNGPIIMFLIALVEEVVLRLLPLGILTSFFKGSLAFYLLFLIPNMAWALLHLLNHKSRSDRQLLRVIPQFVVGVMCTYALLRYGFWMAFFIHLGYNLILLSVDKLQRSTQESYYLMAYYAVVALVTGWLLVMGTETPANIWTWFWSDPLSTLKYFGFWEYVALAVCANAVFELIGGVLLLDRPVRQSGLVYGEKVKEYLAGMITIIIPLQFTSTLGFSTSFVIALAIIMFSDAVTGSMIARGYFTTLPLLVIIIQIMSGVTIIQGALVLLVVYIIDLPTIPWMVSYTQKQVLPEIEPKLQPE